MERNLNIKRCSSCGAMVKILKDCECDNCGIKCCGKEMETLIPNSVDASFEKHIPQIERIEDEVYVKVPHPMEKDHFIEWISQVSDNKEETVYLYPEGPAETRFKYIPKASIYAYCNKHGLWKIDVE